MKIVRTDGCVVSGLDIDNKSYVDLTEEEKQNVWIKLFETLEEQYSDETCYELLNWYLNHFGEETYLYTCDQCGGSVFETKVEI